MIGLWKTRKALKAWGIMGTNRRNNDYVLKYNTRSLCAVADDKVITKHRAIQAGMNVPPIYGVISTEKEISGLGYYIEGRADFVIKPARGTDGSGILIINERFEDRYRTMSGQIVTHPDLEHHVSNILAGLYSPGDHQDRALIEYRVIPDSIFEGISYEGVPDIRIIVLKGYPIMAMLRIPTRQTGGWASQHQDAIGIGLDLTSGITLQGTWLNNIGKRLDITDTVEGFQLPAWGAFMKLAAQCYELTGLGYIGVDMMLDEEHGPLLMEINAQPDLNIQIANDCGLTHRADSVEARLKQLARSREVETPEQRVDFAREFFGTHRR